MVHRILVLDVQGTPIRWMTKEKALKRVVSGKVGWTAGESYTVMSGGHSRLEGATSQVQLPSIIALKGQPTRHTQSRIQPTRLALFKRDRCICAYCAQQFVFDKLTRDHIKPRAQAGGDTWMNLVTACRRCNERKGGRTPEEAGMRLVYVPYRPNRFEDFILIGRHILADQMSFLMAGVPASSRLWPG